MKKAVDFFIYSNIFIALCATALCMFSYEILRLQHNKGIIAAFIFFSTISAYNFHRIRGMRKSKISNLRTAWVKEHYKLSVFLTATSFIIASVLYFLLPNATIILLMPLTLICLWYAVGIMKQGQFERPLREVPFLKIFLIAFVWTGACLMFPAVSFHGFGILSHFDTQVMAVGYSLFVFSLTLPFDIRDLKDDKGSELPTIPSSIGIKRTKILSIAGFIISAAIFFFLYLHHMIGLPAMLAFISACLISSFTAAFSSSNRDELFYSFWLDGCLLLPILFLHLFRHFNL